MQAGPLLTEDDLDELTIYPETFTLAEHHIALIRQSVISWDPTEIGAPAIDPQKPFGSASLRSDIVKAARLSSARDTKRIRSIYAELGHALQTLMWYGELEPGVYQVPHPLKGDWSWLDRIVADYRNTPEPKVIEFQFKEAHRKLLERASLRWTDWPGEFDGDNLNPAPGFDPKRPYGERTYYQLDMAEILGIPISNQAEPTLTEQQDKELLTLHHEMKRALQVFVVKAQIKPGIYKAKD